MNSDKQNNKTSDLSEGSRAEGEAAVTVVPLPNESPPEDPPDPAENLPESAPPEVEAAALEPEPEQTDIQLGDRVLVREHEDQAWKEGIVTQLDPILITADDREGTWACVARLETLPLLPGGYKSGVRVQTTVPLNGKRQGLTPTGMRGTVQGLPEDGNAEMLLVHFDNGAVWNILPRLIKRVEPNLTADERAEQFPNQPALAGIYVRKREDQPDMRLVVTQEGTVFPWGQAYMAQRINRTETKHYSINRAETIAPISETVEEDIECQGFKLTEDSTPDVIVWKKDETDTISVWHRVGDLCAEGFLPPKPQPFTMPVWQPPVWHPDPVPKTRCCCGLTTRDGEHLDEIPLEPDAAYEAKVVDPIPCCKRVYGCGKGRACYANVATWTMLLVLALLAAGLAIAIDPIVSHFREQDAAAKKQAILDYHREHPRVRSDGTAETWDENAQQWRPVPRLSREDVRRTAAYDVIQREIGDYLQREIPKAITPEPAEYANTDDSTDKITRAQYNSLDAEEQGGYAKMAESQIPGAACALCRGSENPVYRFFDCAENHQHLYCQTCFTDTFGQKCIDTTQDPEANVTHRYPTMEACEEADHTWENGWNLFAKGHEKCRMCQQTPGDGPSTIQSDPLFEPAHGLLRSETVKFAYENNIRYRDASMPEHQEHGFELQHLEVLEDIVDRIGARRRDTHIPPCEPHSNLAPKCEPSGAAGATLAAAGCRARIAADKTQAACESPGGNTDTECTFAGLGDQSPTQIAMKAFCNNTSGAFQNLIRTTPAQQASTAACANKTWDEAHQANQILDATELQTPATCLANPANARPNRPSNAACTARISTAQTEAACWTPRSWLGGEMRRWGLQLTDDCETDDHNCQFTPATPASPCAPPDNAAEESDEETDEETADVDAIPQPAEETDEQRREREQREREEREQREREERERQLTLQSITTFPETPGYRRHVDITLSNPAPTVRGGDAATDWRTVAGNQYYYEDSACFDRGTRKPEITTEGDCREKSFTWIAAPHPYYSVLLGHDGQLWSPRAGPRRFRFQLEDGRGRVSIGLIKGPDAWTQRNNVTPEQNRQSCSIPLREMMARPDRMVLVQAKRLGWMVGTWTYQTLNRRGVEVELRNGQVRYIEDGGEPVTAVTIDEWAGGTFGFAVSLHDGAKMTLVDPPGNWWFDSQG